MIQRFVDAFMAAKPEIEAELAKAHPESYDDLVKRVLQVCSAAKVTYGDVPDPNRLTVIDHGDYQGTRLYIVGAEGYQPNRYWSLFVSYGSCSGCDTFEAIKKLRRRPADSNTNQRILDADVAHGAAHEGDRWC